MKNLEEQHFNKLFKIAKNRLDPGGIIVYLVGVWFYILIFFIISSWIIFIDYGFAHLQLPIKLIYILFLCLFFFQLFYLMLCMVFERFIYKTQKLGGILLVIYTIVMIYFPFFGYYILGIDSNKPEEYDLWILTVSAYILLVGCIAWFLTRKELMLGSFKAGGIGFNNLFGKYKSLWTVIAGGAIVLVFFLLFIVGFQVDDFILGTMLLLLGCAVVVGIQEFILIAYCRIKFKSFNVTYEEATKYRVKKRRKKK